MIIISKQKKIGINVILITITLAVLWMANTTAETSGSYNDTNLTIYDTSDSAARYTQCSNFCAEKIKPANLSNVYFYANYTNSSYYPLNSTNENSNCTIRFNENGSWGGWFSMEYNEASMLWNFNRSFAYKGTLEFETNCTSNFGSIIITDDILITNTEPYIIKTAAGYIDFDGDGIKDILNCTEDVLCNYNFSANVSEDDLNDVLVYNYSSAINTTLTDFTVNSSTGILEINITRSENTGSKKVELNVFDTESTLKSAILEVYIQDINDPPYFEGLDNWTLNMSEQFIKTVYIIDEENNTEFKLNITFMECSTAQWSDRNSTECDLFNESHYSFFPESGVLILNFTPLRNDVGSYIVNFSATDNSTLGNKTGSQIVNISVYNVNEAPLITYLCDNERNTTEDAEFTCWIKARDIDETYNLTFFTNYSWLTFNDTGTNQVTFPCNASTDFNASAMINFTASDLQVGNWSVNITVLDIGTGYGAPKSNSTIIYFLVENVEDVVYLSGVNNHIIYKNETYYVNASDDDLLVPDSSIKNEVLTFASNTSWASISAYYSDSNYTTARIDINYDAALASYGSGDHAIKINVTDTADNSAETAFVISIGEDNPATWNPLMEDALVVYEGNLTYMNFSENVSDADGDSITFSYTVSNTFASFAISSLGIINFTPKDADVGFHNVTVNASDGKLDSLKSFNFTVYNIKDEPYIRSIEGVDVTNATVDSNSNINCTEDNVTTIRIWTEDDDFRILQKNFYNESHSLNVTIEGANTNLFYFTKELEYSNFTTFSTEFTPKKSDVGEYNITINVTDRTNLSYFIMFNMTIGSINHYPVIMPLENQSTTINSWLYYRINATDVEDGNSTESGNNNFTFSYSLNQGGSIFNETTFNKTTGEINISFNSSHGGVYSINITVNDSSGLEDTENFLIYVYDFPSINYPGASHEFNLYEDVMFNITVMANNSAQNNLTYLFYTEHISGNATLRYNVSYYGNNTNLTWYFTPNFTDETYGRKINLTLLVYPGRFDSLNTSINWNLTINHTNAPVVFYDNIDDKYNQPYNEVYEINLTNHFSDIDYSDVNYNQTINFSVWSNESSSKIAWNVVNGSLFLSASSSALELLIVNASDMENGTKITNATSNSFEIEFVPPTTTPAPTTGGSGSSGSGSGETTKPVSLKILFADPAEAYKRDRIEIPVTIQNTGIVGLYGINLTAAFKQNYEARNDIKIKFSQEYLDSILPGEEKNSTLTINVNTDQAGIYEIQINATSKSPYYKDWAILHLKVKEANQSNALERLVFTEEYIAENPECIEINEIVDEAWKFYEIGLYEDALSKSREAIDACRYAISQPALPKEKEDFKERFYKYTTFSSLILVIILIVYYMYNRFKIKNRVNKQSFKT